MSAEQIKLLKAARVLVEEDHARGICRWLAIKAYDLGSDADQGLRQYIAWKALDVGPKGEDLRMVAPVFYGEWLYHVLGYHATDDQIRAGRLLWIDQMIAALEAGVDLPKHPPLPPGVNVP